MLPMNGMMHFFSLDHQLYMQNVYITGQFVFSPEISGLRLKLLDKKSEKALLSSYKKVLRRDMMICNCLIWRHDAIVLFSFLKGLSSEIEKEDDPVALLPKVVALLFVQVKENKIRLYVSICETLMFLDSPFCKGI
jgi:hypothetical protein